LPNGDALVAARSGPLYLVNNAAGTGAPRLDPVPVTGVPELVPYYFRGGIHDIILHPKFSDNRLVYFTYNKPDTVTPPDPAAPYRKGSIVSLWRARLSASGRALTEVQELLSGERGPSSGSRIAFGKDGLVYLTTGSSFGDQPQRLDSDYGKVLRVRDDGSIPADNPFVGRTGAKPEIFSYGHRDQLGIAVHPATGAVITAEFGPNGGDEINLILSGRNYGWPLTSFGRQYEGPRWSELPFAAGTELPIVVWLPSIAPFGAAFYSGDKFPQWQGNLLVAGVQRGEIPHTGALERVVFNDKLEEVRRESLLTELHQRIGAVRVGPDGLVYVLTDEDDGALLRLEPAK
jgi:glucose/arabinose dehydrogenase